jgi:hypothetical protein
MAQTKPRPRRPDRVLRDQTLEPLKRLELAADQARAPRPFVRHPCRTVCLHKSRLAALALGEAFQPALGRESRRGSAARRFLTSSCLDKDLPRRSRPGMPAGAAAANSSASWRIVERDLRSPRARLRS